MGHRRAQLLAVAAGLFLSMAAWSGPVVRVNLWFTPETVVNDTVVTLGDITRKIDAPAAMVEKLRSVVVGEASPAGYSRFLNTDEFCAITARSLLPGIVIVNKTPGRVRIATQSQTHSVGEYEAQIANYVFSTAAWAPSDMELTLTNGTDTWKMLKGPVTVTVSGLDDARARGPIRLKLNASQGGRSQVIPVQCRLDVNTAVVVASRTLIKGEMLSFDDVRLEKRTITAQSVKPYTSRTALTGMRVRRTIPEGTMLSTIMLEQSPLISRGEQVRLETTVGAVTVSILMIAREEGHLGEPIWLINEQSKRLVRAIVTGKNSAAAGGAGGST